MGRRLYVGNLPYSSSEDQLTELFSRAGKVDNVRVMRDMATGRARGFAFVEMSTDEEAQRAITELHEHQLDGRALVVNEARPKPEGGFGGGGRGRGGGFGGSGGGNRGGGGYGDDFAAGGAKNRGGKRQRAGSFEEPARCHVRSKARTARSAARSYSSTIQPSRS